MAIVALAGAAIVVLLAPFGVVSVFDGRFELSIKVHATNDIDRTLLLFAHCWTKSEAEHARKTGTGGEVQFGPGTVEPSGTYVISVPHSGRMNYFGTIMSYHHPRYLVVQYGSPDAANDSVRAIFLVPVGRGDRQMIVRIP